MYIKKGTISYSSFSFVSILFRDLYTDSKMPSVLLQNNAIFHSTAKEKSALTTLVGNNSTERMILERQLEQGSVQAAGQLVSMTECKHNTFSSCYNCDKVAHYYLVAFRSTSNKQPILCNSLLLSLVEKSVDLIHSHLEVSKMQHLPWMPALMSELRELGKHLKDESPKPDRLVPLPLPLEQDQDSVNGIDNVPINEAYGRAIRITIYYCRATLCEDMDIKKSINYYRKCVSVRPTQFDTQKLQQSARTALQHLIADQYKYTDVSSRPQLPSRTSSVSSGASLSSSMTCSNCGIEKRGMPVCSKCKSQYYCGVRCLKAHKPVHELACH